MIFLYNSTGAILMGKTVRITQICKSDSHIKGEIYCVHSFNQNTGHFKSLFVLSKVPDNRMTNYARK